MQNFEIVIILFVVLLALMAVADKARLSNAVMLVIAGIVIGFIPALPSLVLDPEIVFLLFLPPVLYDAASHTSWHDFKSEIVPISTLAIILVFFTTIAVAIASYFLIPGFTWPLAFVLGAIVSPPDAVAATSITKGLGLNKRVITILEGESLVNDASALISYRFAIIAIGTGSFVLWKAGIDFLFLATGGIIIGVAIGLLLIYIHKLILNNSLISTSLTLLTPFISYLVAEHLHTSGVLAVVSTGLIISWRAPEAYSYQTRIRNRAVWDTMIFLLNGFIFILIGLQLPAILADVKKYGIVNLLMYGLLVSGVTIVIRLLWVFGAAYSPLINGSSKNKKADGSQLAAWKSVLIIAWTGTRGIVSLATALALPLTFSNGHTFAQRSLILFLAFVVIFITLVVQGLSLPLLIKILRIKANPDPFKEERELRLLMAGQVIRFIETQLPEKAGESLIKRLKQRYTIIIEELEDLSRRLPEKPVLTDVTSLSVQQEIIEWQRTLLIAFHKEGRFNEFTIRMLEQELDHEEVRLTSRFRKMK